MSKANQARARRLGEWSGTFTDMAKAEANDGKRKMLEQFARDLRIAAKMLRRPAMQLNLGPSDSAVGGNDTSKEVWAA